MATDQHVLATAATMADETATEADAQWATAATMTEETATDQPKADSHGGQATVANAQHNLRATQYDH
jgi:hypothetical protein